MYKGILLIFICIAMLEPLQAQEDPASENRGRHRLSILMANSHIPSADNLDGQSAVFIVPTWGFNYDFWLTEKWALGLHTDLVLQQFEIKEKENDQVIERSNPFAVTGVALFKPWEKWTALLGVGREFEKNENFNMLSVGVEYGIELPNNWELSINLIFDNKIEAYDTWMLGVGFSKFVGKANE